MEFLILTLLKSFSWLIRKNSVILMFACILLIEACQDPKMKLLIKTSINIKVSFGVVRILGSCTTKIITKMWKQIWAVNKMLDSLKSIYLINMLFNISTSSFFLSQARTIHRTTGEKGISSFLSTTSTRTWTSRYLYSVLHLRWLLHIFNCSVCNYQATTRWDSSTCGKQHLQC